MSGAITAAVIGTAVTAGAIYQAHEQRKAAKEAAEIQERSQQAALQQQKKAAAATQVQNNRANAQRVNSSQILAQSTKSNIGSNNNFTSAFGAQMNAPLGTLSGLKEDDKLGR